MDTQLIPSSKTHLDGLTAAQRFEAYHYAARPMCHIEPLRDRAAEDARCSGWLVDDVFVGRTSFTWTRFQRSASQAKNGGAFLMEICKGEQYGELDGHPVRIGDDGIVLRDLARPFDTVGWADEMIGFMIPRYRIAQCEWLERHSPVVKFPVATPGGQILLNTVKSVVDLLPGLSQGAATGITSGLVGLLNGLLGNARQTRERERNPQVDAPSLETMKTFLVKNLHDPDLSAATLTRTFHYSRAKVYRLFADEGGVAGFIRQQRLTRCRDDLGRAERKAGMVQEVAERWGFLDPYHFSRLFKRSFGVSPSSVLGAGPFSHGGDETSGENGTQIHNWLRSTFETDGQTNSRRMSMAKASAVH